MKAKKIKDCFFEKNWESSDGEDTLYLYKIEGREGITIMDRMTGFQCRDIETGYRDKDNNFWLASGNFDIRDYPDKTIEEAIEFIKENANTCRGD